MSRHADLPVTVRGHDGVDLNIPGWMTEPAAHTFAVSDVATLSAGSLRATGERLSLHTAVAQDPAGRHPSAQAFRSALAAHLERIWPGRSW